MIMIFDDAVY